MQGTKKLRNKTIKKIIEYRFLYFLALPIVVYLLIYRYYPIFTQFMLSFREYSILDGIFGSEWTGFNNYYTLFGSRDFTRIMQNTVRISVLQLCAGFLPPLVLAILLFDMTSSKFRRISQSILYIPHFFSWVVIFNLVHVLFSNTGYINSIIQFFGGEAYAKYAGRVSWCRNDHENEKEQDFTENCYANYRYYPEMLSSGLLKKEHAEAIYRYRQNFGGEILGMTRLFKDAVDDWPVSHMARYLLENGYKDQYLLLFFAHLCHHGEGKTGVYYEQRAIGGQWVAPDCVPSLMTVPLMLGWMFVYESIGGKELSLLKGVPKAWFETGFKAEGLYSRYGRIDIHLQIKNDKRLLHIRLPQLPKDSSVRLYTDNAECIPLQNQRKIDIEV